LLFFVKPQLNGGKKFNEKRGRKMDTKQRIELAKTNLKRAETTKITLETQKTEAEKQRDEMVEKLKAEGVTPETAAQEIANLETSINENLGKVETLIPTV
jgi:hypothetical protein